MFALVGFFVLGCLLILAYTKTSSKKVRPQGRLNPPSTHMTATWYTDLLQLYLNLHRNLHRTLTLGYNYARTPYPFLSAAACYDVSFFDLSGAADTPRFT